MKILVIDDEYVSISRMTKLLSRWGRCEVATNGGQALELFKKAFEQQMPYDLITFDIEMPDSDGLDLLKQFHDLEDTMPLDGWHSKKIVITAQGNLDNIQKAVKNKCDAFLVKPVKLKILEEKMLKIWR